MPVKTLKRQRFSKAPARLLRGEWIHLRPPQPADYRQFAALMEANRIFFRGLVPAFNRRRHFDEYVARCRQDDYFGFLICRRGDDVVVGKINLFNIIRRGLQTGCVGYLISQAHARQGYATEALRVLLRFAFRQVKLHRVEANIQPHNASSLALVRRAGFACEGLSPRYVKIGGRWRDHERWALLAEDWRTRTRK